MRLTLISVLIICVMQSVGFSYAQSCTDKQEDDMWAFIETVSPVVQSIIDEFEMDTEDANYFGLLQKSMTHSLIMTQWSRLDTCEAHDFYYDTFQEFYDVAVLRSAAFLAIDDPLYEHWQQLKLFDPLADRYELAQIGVSLIINVHDLQD